MKQFLLFLLISSNLFAQDANTDQEITSLRDALENSVGGDRLEQLKKLTKLTEASTIYDHDSIARETINYATSIDSMRFATEQIQGLINYKNNIAGTPEEGIEVFKEFIPLTKGYDNKKWLAKVYLELADSYYFSGKRDSSFIYYDKSLEYSAIAKDDFVQGLAKLYVGGAYGQRGDFSKGSKSLQEASRIFIKLKDTSNLISAKNSLAILYSQNGFFEEAAKERNEGMLLSEKIKNYGKLASFSYNIAIDNKKQGLEKKRIKHLKDALTYSKKSEFETFYKIPFTSALAIAYSENDSILKAEEVLKQLEIDPNNTSDRNRIYYVDAIKEIAKAKGNLKDALSFGKESLQINTDRKSYEGIQYGSYFLSEVYEALGNNNEALRHYKTYTKIKDSITGVQKTRSLAYYQTLYETEKRDNTINAQRTNLTLLEQKNKTRNQLFLFAGTLIALGIFVFILYKNYRQKLQRRLAVEQLRTKISADLHDDVGSLLTGLSMQTELLARQVPQELRFKLERVSKVSKDAMLKMRDAVWAMDARKDNWQSLKDRMNEFASETLPLKDISYTIDVDNIELSKSMQGAVRQNLYLIFKEAIANVLKHSNASKVTITLKRNKSNYSLYISDNGKTNQNLSKAGQGLTNMTLRATQLLGNLQYKNDDGFHIIVNVPSA